jgi:hypothetical protein
MSIDLRKKPIVSVKNSSKYLPVLTKIIPIFWNLPYAFGREISPYFPLTAFT